MKPLSDRIKDRARDAVEWIHDHPQPKYKGAVDCEKCYLGGMAFVLAEVNGSKPEEEYTRLITSARPKRRIVKNKKRVVRRKR